MFGIASKVLLYGMLVLGAASLLFNIGNAIAWIAVFSSFVASLFLSWVLRSRGIHSDIHEFFINVAIWMNILGQYAFYYADATYYDKVLHFLTGALIASIVYRYYRKDSKVGKGMVIFIALGMLAAWEIYEYVLFAYLGVPSMGVIDKGVQIMSPLDDTMMDLICGVIGSSLYFMFYSFFVKEKKK